MKPLLHLIFLAFILVFVSCEKKEGHVEDDKNSTAIVFQFAGVSDKEKDELFASTKGNVSNVQNTPIEQIDVDNNTTLFVSSETNVIASASKTAGNGNKIAATSLMGDSIRYRVLIYEKDGSNWKFFKHHDIVSGRNSPTNNTVTLPLNKQYK